MALRFALDTNRYRDFCSRTDAAKAPRSGLRTPRHAAFVENLRG